MRDTVGLQRSRMNIRNLNAQLTMCMFECSRSPSDNTETGWLMKLGTGCGAKEE